ncbi:MAG: hypothetical protein KDD40_10205, partial [Bdellovibrionales bacterium]|nr:hypothetical protein [Bdellovibrionales bacterium]
FTSAEKVYDENDLALNGYINTGRTSVLSNWLQWQLDKRWWLQTRYELIRKNHQQEANKYSALCAFIPTEFSAVRLQYDNMDYPWQTEIEHRFSLQFNLTMGVHPAHNY